ncbi:response regulator [Amorphus sp. 3PC139-8]
MLGGEPAAVVVAGLLGAAVMAAVAIAWSLARTSGDADARAIAVVEALPVAALSATAAGLVRHGNAAYAELNRTFGATRLVTPLRWAASDPDAAAALYRAVKSAHAGEAAVARLTAPQAAGGRIFDVHVAPLDGNGSSLLLFTVLPVAAPASEADDLQDADEAVLYARLFQRMPVAVALVSRDGEVSLATPRFGRLTGWEEAGSEETPRNLTDVFAEPDRPTVADAISRATAGESLARPIDVALSGEPPRAVRLYVAPFSEEGGAGERAILYAVDTTEQRALEMQFAQSQKMQAVGQLAGGVAHDFNNILTAIIGFSDLLLMNHRPTDPSFQDIMNIKQNANRAAGLVKQLLAYSRRQTLRPSRLHLTDVLADLPVMLDRLLGEKVTLKVVHGRDLWPVLADVSQLEQVIINLSVNARDAMPDGGELTIRTANVPAAEVAGLSADGIAVADHVLVEVADTGTGIPPEVVEKIFEPFFSTKEVGRGTGLGLSTVYGIVKQTGGTILVDSRVGEGTVFRVLLPRAVDLPTAEPAAADAAENLPPADAADAKAPDAAASAGEGRASSGDRGQADSPPAAQDLTGSATILLVEDEDTIRAFAARALTTRGYQVHAAPTGEDALAIARELGGRIDLLVSDVVMPEMDGPTLAVELRKLAPEMPIILMSGYAEDVFARTLPGELEFAFLPKPFTLKALATAVKEALEATPAG